MPSSTSPSKMGPGRLTLRLLAVAAVGWLGCAIYSLCLDPSLRFYLGAARIKQAWAEKMGREHQARVLVYGGSSCAFSINGERILREQGLPVVNMGMGAGYGARFLTSWALSEARPGDTLIVALEPGLLSGDLTDTSDAVHLSYALHQPGLLRNLDNSATFSLASQLLMLRPGGSHLITLAAKIAGGKPLFRYRLRDVHPSGWMQTAVRVPVDSPGPAGALSAQGRRLLKDLAWWCHQRNIRLAYSIPWEFTTPDEQVSFQDKNAAFLLHLAELMPVLKDPTLGVCTNRAYYADTGWHLTEAGANLRSDSLGRQLKEWSTWTEAELRAFAAR
jgi:hypothetical protein